MRVIWDTLSDQVFPSTGILCVESISADDWTGYTHDAYVRLLPWEEGKPRYQAGVGYGESKTITWGDKYPFFLQAEAAAIALAKENAEDDARRQIEADAEPEMIEA